MTTQLMDIPEHIQAEILLRLPAPEDIACASVACVGFHRLVTTRSFHRRFRSLHAPRFLAFLDIGRFQPALPPHPSAPAARVLALKDDFTFSFVPSPHRRRTGRWPVQDIRKGRVHFRRVPRFVAISRRRRQAGRWAVQDIRDGRILLRHVPEGNHHLEFTKLAVCDPLHRRYVMLPAVPQDLAALVMHPDVVDNQWCEPFLVPVDDEDGTTAFGVIWMAHWGTRVAAFEFSSSTGQLQTVVEFTMTSLTEHIFFRRHYAYGCFYWELNTINTELLMLDTWSMEFSIVDLPPGEWTMNIAIVEAGEGRLGMFGFPEGIGGILCYYIKGNEGDSSSQWRMEKTISLNSGNPHYIKAATEKYLLLGKVEELWLVQDEECISIDVKTLQLDMVCLKPYQIANNGTHIYTNFPPSLSAPTI